MRKFILCAAIIAMASCTSKVANAPEENVDSTATVVADSVTADTTTIDTIIVE